MSKPYYVRKVKILIKVWTSKAKHVKGYRIYCNGQMLQSFECACQCHKYYIRELEYR